MQDKLPGIENTSAVTERRACARLRVTSLMYIDIGNVNGGIVTSLSESGLALTAAASLGNAEFGDGPLRMRIQFPGTPEAVEASGEIVWTSPSGKEARVRFVEIGETAREQIRGWISDQVSNNELRPDPPQLPKMQLPTSRRRKRGGPRFSFADVASSRVDEESETGVEDSPQIARQPRDFSPLQAGSSVFRDGMEVVASAFESPAFTEDKTRNTGPSQKEQTTHPTPGEQLAQQANPAIPERRQHARRPILLFTYAVLGEDNGGLVFNLGEGGLALTAAAALQEHHFSKIRVRFPDSEDWFETNGYLAWKSDSGKEAGIEFLNLPADVRTRIAEWASQAELSDPSSREDEARPQELPSFMEPEFSSTEPIEIPASFEEQPFENQVFEDHFEERTKTPAASSSALFTTGIKGILERASLKRSAAKIKPPRLADHSAKPPTRLASKALSIAAGFALAVGGWMFFQRTSLNKASRIVAQNLPNTQPSHEPRQAKAPENAKTEVGSSGTTADPHVQRKDSVAAQNGISTSSLQQIEKDPTPDTPKTAATNANSGSERTSKEKSQTKDAFKCIPTESSPEHSSYQPERPAASSQREPETKSPQFPASVPTPSLEQKLSESKPGESNPAESKPLQIAQGFPAPNKDLSATSALPSATPSQPAAAPPVDLEKEKSPVAPKQPEPILARMPVVTVSFDPFPSIRMPKTEKAKKSHQGKSLQMGRVLSRVDPAYPDEAKQQGVEGTVKLHAIFNRDGTVQSVIQISGPPMLVPAAMNAVRQWRFSQTILGGQAMETEEDVAVLFRLTNSAAKN